MSLVYFHITLITVAVLFSFGLGFWELTSFSNLHQQADLWAGIVSFLFSVSAVCYLVWFIRKKKPGMIPPPFLNKR